MARLGFALLLLLSLPALSIAESRVVSWGYYWRTVGPPFFPANSPPANLTDVVAVAGGAGHSVALLADGRVRAWGDNSLGQTLIPAGLSNVIMVACGTFHSLALRSDGSVVGWGAGKVYDPLDGTGPQYGQSRVPADLTNAVAVAAGFSHSMALRSDGRVVVWGGDDTFGQTNVPPDLDNVVAIASGPSFCLALRADGTVVSWGNQLAATVPPSATNIVAIAAGNGPHALALRADGAVLSWYGDNSAVEQNVPVGLSNVVALATGGAHSLALDAEGKVTAWGAGKIVDIPNGEFGQSMVPADLGSAAAIGAGDLHSLALLREGHPVLFPPAINRTLVYGSTAWLSVPGIVVPSPHYQWRFNGTNLPAGTNALLTLEHVMFVDQGVYSLLVSNQFGIATSSNMTVTVVPLMITNQPQSQAAIVGSTVPLTVGAKGQGPFAYQWQFDGTDMLGETNRTLVLADARSSDSGAYAVIVSNLAGTVRSKEAIVSVSDRAVVYWGNNLAGLTNGTLGLTNVVSVAAGRSHALALLDDGKVLAWGANQFGQTDVPSGLTNVVAISAGGFHSLALKADGKVVEWGYMSSVPANLDQVVAIAARSFHNLALKSDGTVVAWGHNTDATGRPAGQTDVPPGLTNVIAVAAAQYYSMALKADGRIASWGLSPTVSANVTNAVAVSAGGSHGLALRANGTVAAWGQNSHGQATVPNGLTNVVAISAGENHSLALKADGTVVAWGAGDTNVIGFPWPRPPFPEPPHYGQSLVPAGLTNVTAIAAGYSQSLAVVGGGQPFLAEPLVSRLAAYGQTLSLRIAARGAGPLTFQWMFNGTNLPAATNATLTLGNVRFDQAGSYSVRVSNAYGEIVSSDMILSVAPLLISAQPQSQSTHQGATVRLSVTATGQGPFTYQWRFNGVDLPAATNSALVLPNVRIEHSGLYSVVVANAVGSVASESAALSVGQVIAWGNNDFGQTNLPAGLTNVVAVAAGHYHNLVLKGDGTVVSWGYNVNNSTVTGQTNVPAGLSNVVAVAGGARHSLALKADGTVVGWGLNTEGQINIPAGLNDIMAIAAGSAHSLALKRDGTVVGWGNNYYGQAQAPSALKNVVAIAAGIPHSMALKTDGTVSVWGDDGWGESQIPSGLSNVVAIAAGWQHCVALKSDGTLTVWGTQTTVPTGLTNVVAISAGGQHTLARTADGRLVRWGGTPYPVPSVVSNLIAFSAGGAHDLALVGAVPAITLQPLSQKMTVGFDATFIVAATGTEPLSYQWRRDGMDVPGATNSVLVMTNIQSDSGGAYSVRITNAFGTVTSSNAWLTINHPPVADATATKAVVISCNHSNATIVLDASRSYDPDGDALQYSWFKDGVGDALATGAVVPVVLSVGSHAVRLAVNDELATSEQTITLDVITIHQALEQLNTLVKINVPRSQPLTATLSAALATVDRGNSTAAINQLHAFQNQVLAQVRPIDLALAQSLHQNAEEIRDVLKSGCGGVIPPGKLRMVTRRHDGKVRMQFSTLPGAIYVVEASTNLVYWEKVGIAAEAIPGRFEFEDSNSVGLPLRFYRVVGP